MMKKTVSIILMLTLILTSVSFTVFAEDNTSKPPESPLSEPVIKPVELRSEFRYREAFDRFMLENYEDHIDNIIYYNELVYHQDEDGNTDWALIQINNDVPDGAGSISLVGHQFFCASCDGIPFRSYLAVYDVKKDKFIDMGNFDTEYSWHYNLDDYEGLEEAYNMYGYGDLLGDLDKDRDITIADVTIMQRCLAGMWSFNYEDVIRGTSVEMDWIHVNYYSDFNCDGERDIVDATAVQRYLAELPFKRYSYRGRM